MLYVFTNISTTVVPYVNQNMLVMLTLSLVINRRLKRSLNLNALHRAFRRDKIACRTVASLLIPSSPFPELGTPLTFNKHKTCL